MVAAETNHGIESARVQKTARSNKLSLILYVTMSLVPVMVAPIKNRNRVPSVRVSIIKSQGGTIGDSTPHANNYFVSSWRFLR